jgi:hypothetical protein
MLECTNTNIHIALNNNYMTSQEIIALIKQEDLKSVLSYLVAQCNGELEADIQDDYDDDKDLVTLTVYSEYFSKKHLDVLLKHTFHYDGVIFRKHKQKMEITLEIVVNKSL